MINRKMMKKMQKQMQDTISKMQEELESEVVEGQAGGGMVKVQVNGQQEVLTLKIDPGVVDPEDVEMLEDLILAALKDGMKKSQEISAGKVSKLTGGLNLPGLF